MWNNKVGVLGSSRIHNLVCFGSKPTVTEQDSAKLSKLMQGITFRKIIQMSLSMSKELKTLQLINFICTHITKFQVFLSS